MKYILMFCLLAIGGVAGLLPKAAHAFSCTSNGVAIGGTGTYTVPVNVTLSKTSTDIQLTDLSMYSSCSGYLGMTGPTGPTANDALRTYGSSSFSSTLSALGFTGYAILPGGRFNFPLPTGKCVWPDGNCTATSGSNPTTSPINIKIGMTRVISGSATGKTIPAGTEIARFTLEQRGTVGGAKPTWGNGIKTWIFTLKSPLVIPSYACTLNNPDQTVYLPPVTTKDLIQNGAGRYPAATPFNLDLRCDPETTVSVQFDGEAMSGTRDVLANTTTGNSSVGIQMMFNNTPVQLGQRFLAVANATAQQVLNFKAYYYYSGSVVTSGPVKSVSTITLSYN